MSAIPSISTANFTYNPAMTDFQLGVSLMQDSGLSTDLMSSLGLATSAAYSLDGNLVNLDTINTETLSELKTRETLSGQNDFSVDAASSTALSSSLDFINQLTTGELQYTDDNTTTTGTTSLSGSNSILQSYKTLSSPLGTQVDIDA
ncbi:hypothetical protein [Propionispora vibrioides]|uniref:Uncharacterized protein n=1 Tax=Propionispora vibrioides TaxID=112903 RepID=A0A1H8UP65_9FIRM|nr:hypothetical protein [Propionispora vibrioides]SEP04398.1 hypothetical protein SAMN04490178_10944 [Propionispora vibrioides]